MSVRANQDWIELHQDIGRKIATDDEERQQPRRKTKRLSPVSSKRGEQAHKSYGDGQPVPEQPHIVGRRMIRCGPYSHQTQTDKKAS